MIIGGACGARRQRWVGRSICRSCWLGGNWGVCRLDDGVGVRSRFHRCRSWNWSMSRRRRERVNGRLSRRNSLGLGLRLALVLVLVLLRLLLLPRLCSWFAVTMRAQKIKIRIGHSHWQ